MVRQTGPFFPVEKMRGRDSLGEPRRRPQRAAAITGLAPQKRAPDRASACRLAGRRSGSHGIARRRPGRRDRTGEARGARPIRIRLSLFEFARDIVKRFNYSVRLFIVHRCKERQRYCALKALFGVWKLAVAITKALIEGMQMQRNEMHGCSDASQFQFLDY